VIEAKLTQQLTHIEQTPFYGEFVDLTKAFDAMDRERCLQLLGEYGVGPKMTRLIRHFWDEAMNICRASGNYRVPFKSGRGVTLLEEFTRAAPDTRIHRYFTLVLTRPSGRVGAFE
jgi:hypothetical protein